MRSFTISSGLAPTKARGRGIGGHTLVELLIVLVLLPLLLGLSYQALAAAARSYRHQARRAASREAVRVALEVLTSELRSAGPWDLYGIGADSVALRSTVGIGVVCEVLGNRLTIWRSDGIFAATPTDSVLVFVEGDPATTTDDTVMAARIRGVASGPTGVCPGAASGERSLVLEPPPQNGVRVGAPLRVFRPHVYRIYRGGDGRWWLGQRLRGGTIQPLAGPLAPPGQGGLRLELVDAMGRPATGPGGAAGVRVRVRSLLRRHVRLGPSVVSDRGESYVSFRNR